jgi:hypothetical protein
LPIAFGGIGFSEAIIKTCFCEAIILYHVRGDNVNGLCIPGQAGLKVGQCRQLNRNRAVAVPVPENKKPGSRLAGMGLVSDDLYVGIPDKVVN